MYTLILQPLAGPLQGRVQRLLSRGGSVPGQGHAILLVLLVHALIHLLSQPALGPTLLRVCRCGSSRFIHVFRTAVEFAGRFLLLLPLVLLEPGHHLALVLAGGDVGLQDNLRGALGLGVGMVGTLAVGVGVPLVATGVGAQERFLPRVQPLVRL